MINFLIELFRWMRSRKERDILFGRPYFWGEPTDRMGYERHEAFMRCTGIK